MIVQCLCCGGDFVAIPANIALGNSKYCSMKCFDTVRGYRQKIRDALPGTVAQIMTATKLSDCVVRRQLMCLRKRGEAHISHLVDIPARDRGAGTPAVAPYFATGPGTDPAIPLNLRAATTYMMKKRILVEMPSSQHNICKATGYVNSTVFRLVEQMHKDGQCHIQRYYRSKGGKPCAIYKAGPGKDGICQIKPMSPAERRRRYKAKLERTGQINEVRAKLAAEARAKTLRKNGDELVWALFGPLRRAA